MRVNASRHARRPLPMPALNSSRIEAEGSPSTRQTPSNNTGTLSPCSSPPPFPTFLRIRYEIRWPSEDQYPRNDHQGQESHSRSGRPGKFCDVPTISGAPIWPNPFHAEGNRTSRRRQRPRSYPAPPCRYSCGDLPPAHSLDLLLVCRCWRLVRRSGDITQVAGHCLSTRSRQEQPPSI